MVGCGPPVSLDLSLTVMTEITLQDLYKIGDYSFALRSWLFKEGLIGEHDDYEVCDPCELGQVALVNDSSKCDAYMWAL